MTNDNIHKNSTGDTHATRIGTAERQAAADRLGEHFAAGRLNIEEFEERTAAAWNARTEADVQALFVDLPGGSLDGYIARASMDGQDHSHQQLVPTSAPHTDAGAAMYPADKAAVADTANDDDDHCNDDEPSYAWLARILAPLVSVVLFFSLQNAHVEGAWMAFLLIPAVIAITSAWTARTARKDGRRADRA